jgi:CheY-like chemotaxis protein
MHATTLRSLLYCADDKTSRVLTRVLSDLEITVDHCMDPEGAVQKLRVQRFETVLVDCVEKLAAARVLKAARCGGSNQRLVAVGILEEKMSVRHAFDLGAHLVLYKPLSAERTKSSFRAARALMKRERRHLWRVPLEVPVQLMMAGGRGPYRTSSLDIGEGGMAIQLPTGIRTSACLQVSFTLPGGHQALECGGELAWQNERQQAGIRFVDAPAEMNRQVSEWITRQLPPELKDPPLRGVLAHVAPDAGYIETVSPFPIATRISISENTADLRAEALVRIMHPEKGMGVQWSKVTRSQVEAAQSLMRNVGLHSRVEVLITPEGLENDAFGAQGLAHLEQPQSALLTLFEQTKHLPAEDFQRQLRALPTSVS